MVIGQQPTTVIEETTRRVTNDYGDLLIIFPPPDPVCPEGTTGTPPNCEPICDVEDPPPECVGPPIICPDGSEVPPDEDCPPDPCDVPNPPPECAGEPLPQCSPIPDCGTPSPPENGGDNGGEEGGEEGGGGDDEGN